MEANAPGAGPVTPEQAAHDTAAAISEIPAQFMLDLRTYERGTELGFEGVDFYIAGRGGALGDVDADVVTAAFVFFAPDVVRAAWERSADVMPRRRAVQEFMAIGHAWGREHLAPDDHVAVLLGRVVDAASVAAAPLFAAFRRLPEPPDDDTAALVLHRLNALRELRMALHASALLTVGLSPVEAVAVRSAPMAQVFGWSDLPAVEPLRDRWALAEARTDRMMGRHYRPLDHTERTELVARLGDLR